VCDFNGTCGLHSLNAAKQGWLIIQCWQKQHRHPFSTANRCCSTWPRGLAKTSSQLWSSYHCTILYHHYNWIWDPWRTACGSFPLYGWEAGRLLCRFALCL
jgi:hypothetical protein